MTQYTAADLAMADRHIAEGEAQIVKQEQILTTLCSKGLPTMDAEPLLRLFNECQVEHRTHREAIAQAIGEAARGSDRFGAKADIADPLTNVRRWASPAAS